jgi:hypothetical protein
MTEVEGTTKVQLGKLVAGQPVVNNEILIENLLSEVCFDTVWYEDLGLLLVDCAVHLRVPDEEGFSYRNIFYYVDTNEKVRLNRTVETPMYAPFRELRQRRVLNYTDPATQLNYLIRAYLE